jgi:hypothetical protein
LPTIACDVLVVGGFVLTAVGQQAPASGSLVNSPHAFWYGVLVACLIVWILPGVAGLIFFVVALVASELLSTVSHGHVSTSAVMMLILVAIGLVVGLYFGRIRGLRHLGESDFRTRLTNIRKISPF